MRRLEAASAAEPCLTERRRRVTQLLPGRPYAAELLRLYGVLLATHEQAFVAARDDRPAPADLASYVVERVLAGVVEDTVVGGPPTLAAAARERVEAGGLETMVDRWLGGEGQPPVDEYLARAASLPVLEALGPAVAAACRGPREAGNCPRCGGRPQLAYFTDSGEALVTAPRRLLCSRCGHDWIYERVACPACEERSAARLSIHADPGQLPHLRADGCETCRRYVITVDLRKDPEAVAVVDELVALPLDLHMQERGFAKIVPNLMGI
ncbi:MAG TPA: formate dehydrogenase accessory protein FdhE [Methylomirabilota bacterium]|nr:formate dehydrogenase accessory protein FdhE [Methylomirabilota bacterium]